MLKSAAEHFLFNPRIKNSTLRAERTGKLNQSQNQILRKSRPIGERRKRFRYTLSDWGKFMLYGSKSVSSRGRKEQELKMQDVEATVKQRTYQTEKRQDLSMNV
ncbi:5116_t:CDS:2 [Paraglomus occultum]|uniref:5116_t:CDS:1 n=1 Tax=Paraglomus occultum TaxID=144539 RepID=A0A9N9FMY0_9GLOM|nr:5116_t:CDS:2 [Paraglomus occultum]